ncbi:MAG: hypothetical protein II857_11680 [Selenomonadaceae bacterium]|nr:hypothetical protein [Selenomonadaceae bacterium]
MWQKGFATILSLCLILVVALIVKGIHESETNHAREVSNFELEQALQSAAESGVVEAAEYVRKNPKYLPYSDGTDITKTIIPVTNKTFKRGEQTITITVKAWGERGKIYFYNNNKNKIATFRLKDEEGNFFSDKKGKPIEENYLHGVYLMSRASIEKGFWGKQIYRRAYAYFLSKDQDAYKAYEKSTYQAYEKVYLAKFEDLLKDEHCEQKIHFMELPTQDGNSITKSN